MTGLGALTTARAFYIQRAGRLPQIFPLPNFLQPIFWLPFFSMVFSVFVISDNNFVLPFFSAISVFVAEFFVARFSVAHFPVAVFSVAVFSVTLFPLPLLPFTGFPYRYFFILCIPR